MRNLEYPRCLDIPGPSQVTGAKLHMWDCYGSWSQQWNIK
ncbi:RICIN domain-containing protein [Paractinoplanes lichenicola]